MTKRDYMAYLLRLWRENSEGAWRALLENPNNGERAAFATLPALVAYLAEKTEFNMEIDEMQLEITKRKETAVSNPDEQAICDVVQALTNAWNNNDSPGWSDHLVKDVQYTVWNGHHVVGRDTVTKAHAQLFETVYKDFRQVATVRWVRFICDDVAAVQWDVADEETPDLPKVRPLAVLKKQNGRWLIEIFQNTPVMPETKTN